MPDFPELSDFPPIPLRSSPEADFDGAMVQLFQHFAGTFLSEMRALLTAMNAVGVVDESGALALGHVEARTVLDVLQDVEFDPSNSVDTATAILRGGDNSALGAFGGALVLSKPNSSRPGVVLAAKQTSGDADTIGLSIFTHGGINSNDETQEVLTISHDGKLGLGTSEPTALLHVFQSGSPSTGVRAENSDGYADFVADLGRARIIADSGDGSADFYPYGRIDAVGDTANNNHKLGAFANNLLHTNDVVRVRVARGASADFDMMRLQSSGGANNEFRFRGDGNAFASGSWQSGGADYAEFFEWVDGNPTGEDRRGVAVVLDGDKIRPAVEGETPFGVISANPSVLGDADIDRWKCKYLTDDFGSPILEDFEVVQWEAVDPETGAPIRHQYAHDALPPDIEVPEDAARAWDKRRVLNPEYNPDQLYLPRSERPEWAMVGLMGKLRLRKGQPVSPGWIKMRDISDAVEEWLVK